jgi:hypothetical protein
MLIKNINWAKISLSSCLLVTHRSCIFLKFAHLGSDKLIYMFVPLFAHARNHYRKQSLHREPEGSPKAKGLALGADPLRREHQVPLSVKAWLTVQSTFAESVLASALGEGLS